MSDEPRQNETIFTIGEDLYGVSLDELRERLSVLRFEGERIEAEIAKKEKDMSAAHELFGRS